MSGSKSIDNDSSAIIPSGGYGAKGGFSISGQLDWANLIKLPFEIPIGILSRISAARVDPYTIVVGQRLGHLFQLTLYGRQHIQESLSKLRPFQTLGRALYIGVGLDHIIHILARTEEGKMCILLCATLSEFYGKSTAAQVLIEMVKTSRAPEELRPSIMEWEGLVDACAGVFTTSLFPALAEKYMQLHPEHKVLGLKHRHNKNWARDCSSAESLAKTLLALAEVTQGELSSITIIGRADAGWLAAFAEWFFGLAVRIIWGPTNEVLYPGSGSEQDCQVLIILNGVPGTEASRSLITTDKTYRLLDAADFIQVENREDVSNIFVAGRLEWDSLLDSVFGPELKKLIKLPHAVGAALGSLARILQAVAGAEDGIKYRFRQTCAHYNDSSYGKGLVVSIIRQFPELILFKDSMEKAVRQDSPKAFADYEASMAVLRTACDCLMCKTGDPDPKGYCLLIIIEVIAVIARAMSVINLPTMMYPSRIGIEAFYARQVDIWRTVEEATYSDKAVRKFGPAYRVLKTYPRPIFSAMRIFSGWVPIDLKHYDTNLPSEDRTCAFSANGVCAYYEALSQLSDDSESFARVNVVPGRVELHGKVYAHMTDFIEPSYMSKATDVEGWPDALSLKEVSILVRERSTSLQIAFEVYGSDPSISHKILMYPAATIQDFWNRRGLIQCRSIGCSLISNDVEIREDKPGYKLCQIASTKIEVFEVDLLRRWILMSTKSSLSRSIFYADKECINCCFRAAVGALPKRGHRDIVIIRPRQDNDDWNAIKIPTNKGGHTQRTKKAPNLFNILSRSEKK